MLSMDGNVYAVLSRRAELGSSIYNADQLFTIACSILSLYNACELMVAIFFTFKRYRGLYFWSLLVATFGVFPFCIGWNLMVFEYGPPFIAIVINAVGWILLITGQSVVLYSRLHLVCFNTKLLRVVLGMIICNAVVWHALMPTLALVSAYIELPSHTLAIFSGFEKCQLTCFFVQEVIISFIYIEKAIGFFKTAFGNTRQLLWELLAMNVVIILMDIAILVSMYNNNFLLECGLQVVVYSVKMKLELAVLGQLVHLVQNTGQSSSKRSGGRSIPNNTGFLELSGHHPTSRPSASRSASVPMDALKTQSQHQVIVGCGGVSPSPNYKQGQIQVITNVEVESCDAADDKSVDQLNASYSKASSERGS